MLLKTKTAAEMDIRLEAVGNQGEIKPMRHVVLTKEASEVEAEDAHVILVMYAESVMEAAPVVDVVKPEPRTESSEAKAESEELKRRAEEAEATEDSNNEEDVGSEAMEKVAEEPTQEAQPPVAAIKPIPKRPISG